MERTEEFGASSSESASSGDVRERMIIAERKVLAQKLGLRVSDLEEALDLSLAEAESVGQALTQHAQEAPPSSLYLPASSPNVQYSSADVASSDDSEDDEDSKEARADGDPNPIDDDEENDIGSISREQREKCPWYNLPHEIADRILILLGSVDMLGYLSIVAKTNPFKPSEHVYRSIAEDIYPRQFGTQTKMNIKNWGGSWKTMLIHRPRIRTNGFFTLKTLYTKPPTNDSFDEPKIVGSIETPYYRHFRFFDEGKVLYSPSTIDPFKMGDILSRSKAIDKQVFMGCYIAKGRRVQTVFRLHYCEIQFELEVLDGCESYSNYPGRHSVMRIVKHSQALADGSVWEFPLPINCDCRFWRDWRYCPSPDQGIDTIKLSDLRL